MWVIVTKTAQQKIAKFPNFERFAQLNSAYATLRDRHPSKLFVSRKSFALKMLDSWRSATAEKVSLCLTGAHLVRGSKQRLSRQR